MGGCATALDDAWAATDNVACWAYREQPSMGIAVRQNHLMKELSLGAVYAAIPISKTGTMVLDYNHYGNLDYNEQRASLTYAMRIGRRDNTRNMAVGVRFDYLHSGTATGYYDPLNIATFSAGLQIHASKHLIVGLRAFSPFAIRLNTNEATRIPSLFSAGASYKLADELIGTAEVEKVLYRPPRLRIGVEYGWDNLLYARMGMATNPGIFTFGIGYKHRHFAIDMAVQTHPQLGMTPQLSTHYDF